MRKQKEESGIKCLPNIVSYPDRAESEFAFKPLQLPGAIPVKYQFSDHQYPNAP